MYPRETWIAGGLIFLSVGGISNPLQTIEQITYLLFLHRLDDLHMLEKNKPARLNLPMDRRIFPKSNGSVITLLALQRDFAFRIAAVEKLKTNHRTVLAKLAVIFASLQTRAFRGGL